MLTNVPEIDQNQMKSLFAFGIESGQNILIIGPSGGGKTHIAMQEAEKAGCKLVYINLSVLERTDFQGLPVLSADKSLVSYATADFLPFSNTQFRDESKSLSLLQEWLSQKGEEKNKKALNVIKNRMSELDQNKLIQTLQTNINFIEALEQSSKTDLKSKDIKNEKLISTKEEEIVFLFDEVDKAANEVLQTLLEFLQFHSINGRKMKIKSCILTGNLPDEFANSSQISHAITKRCLTYKLVLDFNQWRHWAYENNIHEQIVGFLTSQNDFLYKPAPNNDPTAYALPSPRTWESASKGLRLLDNSETFSKMQDFEQFRIKVVAGSVGTEAAIQFSNWLKFYYKMDPVVLELMEKGKHPNVNTLDNQEVFICALSACSKVYSSLKPGNEANIKKYVKNVFSWINTLQADVQMGSIRLAWGGDFEIVRKFNLSEIDEFSTACVNLHKLVSEIN